MDDPGYSLEEVHEMLDSVEAAITELDSMSGGFNEGVKLIEMEGDVWLMLEEMYRDGLATDIGVNASMLRQIVDKDKPVRVAVAKAALERVRTYLRTLESTYSARVTSTPPMEVTAPPRPPEAQPAHVEVVGERWVYVRDRSDVQDLISTISVLLDEMILIAGKTNTPPDQAAITEIERQQLIAILETALAMLKGPMVEPGLLKRLRGLAKSTAKKTIEKQAERAMGVGLENLGELLISLLSKLG